MNNLEFGLSELYEVFLKATYPIEINGQKFEEDDVIFCFDKVQISNISEIKNVVSANGGFDNRARVIWETVRELPINFSQGVISKTQFALLNNAKLINHENNFEKLKITKKEELESDENGYLFLKELPLNNKVNVIKKNTGERLEYTLIEDKKIQIQSSYENVIVNYNFEYLNNYDTIVVGQKLIEGFVKLEAKTRVKDDITGHTHTGIFIIPKLKIMSNLSIRLGKNAAPLIGNFSAIGHPIGNRYNKKVMELHFLHDDIDSDF